MNLTKKIIKEFEEKINKNKQWELVPNTPRKIMMSDSEAVKMFKDLKSFLLSSLHQVATEAIEAVRLEKRGTHNYTSSHEAIMHSDFDAGYNSAITAIEQKAKKFLEDNFLNL